MHVTRDLPRAWQPGQDPRDADSLIQHTAAESGRRAEPFQCTISLLELRAWMINPCQDTEYTEYTEYTG